MMKVKFGFDAQFCGRFHEIVDLPDNTTEDKIIAMFPEILGLPFDNNCYYEILEVNNE